MVFLRSFGCFSICRELAIGPISFSDADVVKTVELTEDQTADHKLSMSNLRTNLCDFYNPTAVYKFHWSCFVGCREHAKFIFAVEYLPN